jgi:hypothetical protein
MKIGRFCQEFLAELAAAVGRERRSLMSLSQTTGRARSDESLGPSTEIAELIARLDDISARITLLQPDAPSLRECESETAASLQTDDATEWEDPEIAPLLLACAQYDLSAHRTLSHDR